MPFPLASVDFLMLPGRDNSDPGHWIAHWLGMLPNSSRVLQENWAQPDKASWVARVDAAIASAPRRVVLIGHSAGVATAICWAAQASPEKASKVAAAFLAAPTNVDNPDPAFDLVRTFSPMPVKPLPFPTLVCASRNDPRVTFPKAQEFAGAWGADLADLGDADHIGTAAGLGTWPAGLILLGGLLARIK